VAHVQKKPNPPRRCIFCNGTPISKEHIWPKWMRDYLPRGEGAQVIQELALESGGRVTLRPGPLTRRGDARSQKLKVVCAPCNNGWMGGLQGQAKPILLPLLATEQKTLGQLEQKTLASWATMFTAVYETCYSGLGHPATTAQQRTDFKRHQNPPLHWVFWVAPFDGSSSPAVQMGFGSKNVRPVPSEDATQINKVSLTLFGAGGVSFAVFSVNSESAYQAFSQFITMIVEQTGFVRLWPTSGEDIRVTDRRTSPLGYSDFVAIRQAVTASLRIAATKS
jgi:hypothetical protein